MHLVLSRKYRPQRFEDLVGQEHVARTLSNAITSDRVGHAYLFIGPRGTGKTTTARIFAKALNCEKGPTPTPCGTCDSCVSITAGSDLDVVEMDAASNNGVDDVRALRDSVGYRPARSRFRVWIVDEVHMLSLPAFNAFLKTLEEPPPQAKFLFCTTEAHKLPETFSSRVQRLEFRRIDEGKMGERLRGLVAREGATVEDGVIEQIAAGALGGLRDAESLLEQLLSSSKDRRVALADLDAVIGRAPAERIRDVLDAVLAGDAGAALDAADACLDLGGKPDVVLDQWVEELRALLVAQARASGSGRASPRPPAAASSAVLPSMGPPSIGPPAMGPPSTGPDDRAARFGLPRVARSIDLLLEKRRALRDGADGRLLVELAAIELARLPSARDLDALIDALKSAGSAPSATGQATLGTSLAQRRGGPASPEASVPETQAERPPVPRPRPAPARPESAGESVVALGHDPTRADAPGSAPRAAVGAALPAAMPTLERVVAQWGDVLREASKDRRLGSALAKVRVASVDAGAVVLALAASDGYGHGYLRDRAGQDAFRTATRDALGVALRPLVVDEGSPAYGSPASAAARAPAAATAEPGAPLAPRAPAPRGEAGDDVRRHPDVKAVLDAFGARLLAVQRVPEVPAALSATEGMSGTECTPDTPDAAPAAHAANERDSADHPASRS